MRLLDVEWSWLPSRGLLAACHYVSVFLAGPPLIWLSLIWLLLCCPSLRWLYGVYLLWWAWDARTPSTGGRRWEAFRRARIWRSLADYFPARLHRTAELSPERNYLLAAHPHGLFAVGMFLNFGTEGTGFSETFPGITPYPATLVGQFSPTLPLRREYIMFTGVVDVSAASLRHVLSGRGSGKAAVVVIGGARETLEAAPGCHRLHLSRRRGFCRLALETGASLVPVYTFGEEGLYSQAANPPGSRLRRFQDWVKPFIGIALPILQGRGLFNRLYGYLPQAHALNTVVGAPIDVALSYQPTPEAVSALHARYVAALAELFEANKRRFGLGEEERLEIV